MTSRKAQVLDRVSRAAVKALERRKAIWENFQKLKIIFHEETDLNIQRKKESNSRLSRLECC